MYDLHLFIIKKQLESQKKLVWQHNAKLYTQKWTKIDSSPGMPKVLSTEGQIWKVFEGNWPNEML